MAVRSVLVSEAFVILLSLRPRPRDHFLAHESGIAGLQESLVLTLIVRKV